MTTQDWLQTSSEILNKNGIGTARLDCLVLLEDATGKDRAWLLAHPEENLTKLFTLQGVTLQQLNSKRRRRAEHQPLAYIRGKSEFYGRDFIVNKNVLEPRPESETMIELLKQLVAGRQSLVASNLTIVDVGTGSGALAITAKLEIPNAKVIATDIDPKCLVVAKKNAQKLGAKVKFFQDDLLEPFLQGYTLQNLQKLFTVLLCNLPYVPDSFKVNQAAAMEPKIAIFGGSDGLDLYRQLFKQINSLPAKPYFVLCESMPPQHKKLAVIAKKAGYRLKSTKDFVQLFKQG